MKHLFSRVGRYRNLALFAVVLFMACSASAALAADAQPGTPAEVLAEVSTSPCCSQALTSGAPGRSQPAEPTPTGASGPGITRLEDEDPGPPFAIEVSTLRVEGGKYKLTGIVRNDGPKTYEGIGVVATFYTWGPSGRGTSKDGFYRHGPVIVRCPCLFLEPGAACPFSLEIYARDYAAYMLHPQGQPLSLFKWHEPASVTLSAVRVSNDGIGNVRITGAVVNENDFTVRNATVAGVLLDASGQIVSVGSARVYRGIAPGTSASFDLRIRYAPYARYELTVQGARY